MSPRRRTLMDRGARTAAAVPRPPAQNLAQSCAGVGWTGAQRPRLAGLLATLAEHGDKVHARSKGEFGSRQSERQGGSGTRVPQAVPQTTYVDEITRGVLALQNRYTSVRIRSAPPARRARLRRGSSSACPFRLRRRSCGRIRSAPPRSIACRLLRDGYAMVTKSLPRRPAARASTASLTLGQLGRACMLPIQRSTFA